MMNCKDCEGHGWDEDTRGNMIVCKRCAGTGITLHPGDLAALAAANGYVKADPPITSMHDPRLGIKRPEPWHIDIDALAVSAGYVKLEPGQIVVDTKVWLPYLVKAINAAKILQNHGAFTVKHYHGDWPSLEMLEGLKRAIDGQPKDGK